VHTLLHERQFKLGLSHVDYGGIDNHPPPHPLPYFISQISPTGLAHFLPAPLHEIAFSYLLDMNLTDYAR